MTDRRERLIPWIVIGGLSAFLMPAAWPVPVLRIGLCIVFVVCCLQALAILTGSLRIRGKYDLASLRDLDERERRREIEDAVPDVEGDRIFCPRCGEEYDSKYTLCPHCAKHG